MAYNETIAQHIREQLRTHDHWEELHMFGGLCFMVNDKMCVGVVKDDMMCRIGEAAMEEALSKNGCRPMDFTKRPMKGYVYVEDSALTRTSDYAYWVGLCLAYNPQAPLAKKKPKK